MQIASQITHVSGEAAREKPAYVLGMVREVNVGEADGIETFGSGPCGQLGSAREFRGACVAHGSQYNG